MGNVEVRVVDPALAVRGVKRGLILGTIASMLALAGLGLAIAVFMLGLGAEASLAVLAVTEVIATVIALLGGAIAFGAYSDLAMIEPGFEVGETQVAYGLAVAILFIFLSLVTALDGSIFSASVLLLGAVAGGSSQSSLGLRDLAKYDPTGMINDGMTLSIVGTALSFFLIGIPIALYGLVLVIRGLDVVAEMLGERGRNVIVVEEEPAPAPPGYPA